MACTRVSGRTNCDMATVCKSGQMVPNTLVSQQMMRHHGTCRIVNCLQQCKLALPKSHHLFKGTERKQSYNSSTRAVEEEKLTTQRSTAARACAHGFSA
eukprot:6260775-Amphidinium_carterae.1